MNNPGRVVNIWGLLSAMPRGMMILNEDSTILAVTPPLTRLSGYEAKEMEGQNVSMLIPPEADHPHLKSLREYVRNGSDPKPMKPLSGLPLLRKDGTTIKVNVERMIYRLGGKLMFGGIVERAK